MIVGVGLDSRLGLPFDQLQSAAVEAARLGYESVWTPAGGVPDAFHVCSHWSTGTAAVVPGGLRTGISVVPAVRLWNVPALAVQAATVGQLSGGRFVLGIGTGGYGSAFWAGHGLPERPIAVMREFTTALRRLLAGETVAMDGVGVRFPRLGLGLGPERVAVPVAIATLGPQMLRLAGQVADGALLNWATPAQIAVAREQIADGAAAAGRDASAVVVTMYIRVCVDDDVDAARRALGEQVLGYAMARPGIDKALGYRGQFARMGFDDVLTDLEGRREKGAGMDALVEATPDEMLRAVGYYGPADGAADAYRSLSQGLDETVVRVVTARPGLDPVVTAMEALTPARLAVG